MNSKPTEKMLGIHLPATAWVLWLVLPLGGSLGCQTFSTGSGLPGLNGIGGERKLAQLAAQDPFPSPSDVGIQSD